jgi:predicted  nucleic acid-binding Zn-ribbon protein
MVELEQKELIIEKKYDKLLKSRSKINDKILDVRTELDEVREQMRKERYNNG